MKIDLGAPLRSPSLASQAASRLEDMITSGGFAVGARIPTEGELAERWGLSRNTVREGLRSLVHSGLLESRAGDGTYVRASSELAAALKRRAARAPLGEAIEVRLMIERQVARLAAGRRTPQDVGALRDWRERLGASIAANDPDAYAAADEGLHRAVAACARNALLADMSEHLAGALKLKDAPELWDHKLAVEELQYHAALVEAIAAGDADAAESAAANLIGALRDELSNEFAE